jgi:hypothetical protein
MIRNLRLALVLVVAVLGPATASAAPADPGEATVPLDTLAAAVAAWVAQAMAVPLPAELPEIAFADPRELARMRTGAEPASEAPRPLEVVALYDDASHTIHLPRGWTGGTPAELSVLAHEMVHHLQNVAGRRYACPAEREAEAYAIQERWLEQFGTGLESTFRLNRLALFLLTRCGI